MCIGCHACSTACKSENEVPLGVYRTWVKTTEVGQFPDVTRHFQVTRCNHCANPPCVRICPTEAMYQRADGIVEFESDACIGCKACLQACPYDAIHIDPETKTASKCHYCAHRTDIGLEPACVVVCPEHAIIAGDMNDPTSEISRVLATTKTTVRKPEQGTSPKLFYIEGTEVNLHPTITERAPTTFTHADVLAMYGEDTRPPVPVEAKADRTGRQGQALRAPQPQGMPDAGPLLLGGKRVEGMVQVNYNAQHEVPWHWMVPAYLVTKGIGAGVIIVLALTWLLGATITGPVAIAAGLVSLVMMGATTALLVLDLEHPERFLYILMRPQWRSWLTRGAVFLIGFTNLVLLWWAIEVAGHMGWIGADLVETARLPLFAINTLLGVGTAVYTAFLFGQAEGRDLWQSPLLPPHLLIQALMIGSATLLLIGAFVDMPERMLTVTVWTFGASLLADLFVTLLGEFGMAHASEVAARAAHEISHGRYKTMFWIGAIVVGHVLPLCLIALGGPAPLAIAAVATGIGLYCFEHAFVMAPQEIPNS
ncbi:MAG: polysulfide reductase NrfD [Deltaproteobacteria bacterium]|nr:polysulfide reductase NrfD [Deltaproteobacteria bacterium]